MRGPAECEKHGIPVCRVCIVGNPESGPIYEVDETETYFRHRIVFGERKGNWTGWNIVATLEVDGHLFFAVSEYFRHYFPIRQVLEAVKGDTFYTP